MTRASRHPVRFVFEESTHGPATGAPRVPPVDVVEDADGWRLVFEIAGARADSVSLEIQGRVVSVRGVRVVTAGERGSFLRVERAAGPFERCVELPDDPDPEAARAAYVDGLLTVEVPRRPSSRSRTIPVRGAGEKRAGTDVNRRKDADP